MEHIPANHVLTLSAKKEFENSLCCIFWPTGDRGKDAVRLFRCCVGWGVGGDGDSRDWSYTLAIGHQGHLY